MHVEKAWSACGVRIEHILAFFAVLCCCTLLCGAWCGAVTLKKLKCLMQGYALEHNSME